MKVEQVHCPSCAASVPLLEGTTEAKCLYCGTSLQVRRNDGETALILTEQMNAALKENAETTLDELKRIQLRQELSHFELRLATIQVEIRSLERLPHSAVTSRQLHTLHREAAHVTHRVVALRNALFPPTTLPVPTTSHPQRQARRWGWLLFLFNGRIDRAAFWIGVIVSAPLFMIGSFLVSVTSADAQAASPCLELPGTLLVLASFWIFTAISVKRFHDRNKSGWWVLIGLLPVVGGIWLLVELGCLPGTSRDYLQSWD